MGKVSLTGQSVCRGMIVMEENREDNWWQKLVSSSIVIVAISYCKIV